MSDNDRMRQMRMTPLEAREHNGLKGFGFTVSWPDNGPAWSTDISAAPRGKRVTVRKIGKDGKQIVSTRMEREPVWLASKCGKVILAEWQWPRQIGQYGTAMTRARWNMLGETEQPLAWRPFIEGEFPSHIDPDTKKRVYPNGKGPEFPAMVLGVVA